MTVSIYACLGAHVTWKRRNDRDQICMQIFRNQESTKSLAKIYKTGKYKFYENIFEMYNKRQRVVDSNRETS